MPILASAGTGKTRTLMAKVAVFTIRPNSGTFYYLLEWFGKPQRAQRHAEKNKPPLRISASSAVNLFCQNPFIRNILKSLQIAITDVAKI